MNIMKASVVSGIGGSEINDICPSLEIVKPREPIFTGRLQRPNKF